jgi:hypothetical protein
MSFVLDTIWNHHLLAMAGVYVVLWGVIYALAHLMLGHLKQPQARAQTVSLSLMVALLPWLGVKLAVHEYLGGHAIAIAQQMPAKHPQLAEYERARAAHDLQALNRWAQFNRDPVDAGVIVKTQVALDKLPPSMFKSNLEHELATGYISRARFEASALSIINIAVNELGADPALVDLATQIPRSKPSSAQKETAK